MYPLHLAAINGQLKVMKLLFASQADVTIKDWENMNCLDHAIKQGHEYVGRGGGGGVNCLDHAIKQGNEYVQSRGGGVNCLDHAIKQGNEYVQSRGGGG